MADSFNIADGSVATILKEGSPVSLIKGYQPNTWFYAPRTARIARDGADRPLFAMVRNRQRLPGGAGFETIGGAFGAQLQLSMPIPNLQEQEEWQEHISAISGMGPKGTASFKFQPLRLRSGKMSILGADAYVTDAAALVDIPVAASSTLPLSLQLNKLGADTFYNALGSKASLPLVVFIEYTFDMVLPQFSYTLSASVERTYKFFSENVKARASYWGWVGGQYDRQKTREELQSSGSIDIDLVAPEGFDDSRIKALEERIIDSWAKYALSQIAEKPQLDPAVAANPSGFFGGVSVSMKEYNQVQNINLDVNFEGSEIVEEPYNISYAFAHQFENLNANEYVTDILEDNQLPIIINVGADPRVVKYSGQFGYRRPDGSYVASGLPNIAGSTGGVVTGNIQFGVGEEMPVHTEVQLSIDWQDPNWQDRVEKRILKNGDSGSADTFSPGNNVAQIQLITNLATLEPGAISIINWKTEMPPIDGEPQKIYSGGLYLVGAGDSGEVETRLIEFPYYQQTENDSRILWNVTVTRPDGSNVTKPISTTVSQAVVSVLVSSLEQ